MEEPINLNPESNNDGIYRRGFLECMARAGTGVIWMMSGGIIKSFGMMIVYLALNGIQEQLPTDQFLQVHKSYSVNVDQINAIEGNLLIPAPILPMR